MSLDRLGILTKAIVQRVLAPGESVVEAVAGESGTALVLTDRALIGYSRKGGLKRWLRGDVDGIEYVGIGGRGSITIHGRDAKAGGHPETIALWVASYSESREPVNRVRAALGESVAADPRPARLEAELSGATQSWTASALVRTYRSDGAGDGQFRAEAELLGRHGYVATTQWEQTGELKTRRLLLTGGLGTAIVYARGKGGVHEIGTRTVTFAKIGATG